VTTDLADVREDDLHHRIGRSLLRSLPETWRSVDFDNNQKKYISLRSSGVELYDAFIELARRMGEGGHGKWRKAVSSMTANGESSIDFAYGQH